MNARTTYIYLAIALVALLVQPLGAQCNCNKVKITGGIGSGLTPKFNNKLSGAEHPIEPNKVLTVPVNIEGTTETAGSGPSSMSVSFPYCGIEWQIDGGNGVQPDAWKKGSSLVLPIYGNSDKTYSAPSFYLRLSGDCATTCSAEAGSEAGVTTSPASYDQGNTLPANANVALAMGGVPVGVLDHMSAGSLSTGGPVSADLAAPSSLEYTGFSEVQAQVTESSETVAGLDETHYTTPEFLFRVQGWNYSTDTAISVGQATETKVTVYHGDDITDPVISTYQLERIEAGGGWNSGLRLAQNIRGLVSTTEIKTQGNLLHRTVGGGTVEELAIPGPNNSWTVVETEKRDGVTVYHTTKAYEEKPFGPALVSETKDPDLQTANDEYVTSYTYYEAGLAMGRLESVQYPDGSWESYEYEIVGINGQSHWKETVSRPFLDEHLGGAGALETETLYSVVNGEPPLSVITKRSGVEIAHQTASLNDALLAAADNEPVEVVSRTERVDAGIDLSSVQISYQDSSASGEWKSQRPLFSAGPQGRATLYSYQAGSFVNWVFDSNGPPSHVMTVRTQGLSGTGSNVTSDGSYKFAEVPNSSTRTITIDGPHGVEQVEHQLCDSTGAWHTYRTVRHTYEVSLPHRPLYVYLTDGSNQANLSMTQYVSPTVTQQWDSEGAITETHTDIDGRVVKTISPTGLVTDYVHNGLTTTTKVNSVVRGVAVRDLMGRVVSQTNAIGAVYGTSFHKDANGKFTITRQTAPGNIVTESLNHYSGRQQSVTGPGVIDRHYAYAYASGKYLQVTEYTGKIGPRKTVTDHYMHGAVRTVTTPNPTGTGDVVKTYHYDFTGGGKLTHITSDAHYDAGIPEAAQVFALAENGGTPSQAALMGNYRLQGLDDTGTFSLAKASDQRVSESVTDFVSEGGKWWRRTTSTAFDKSQSALGLTSVQKERLSVVITGGNLEQMSKVTAPSQETATTTRLVKWASAEVEVTVTSDATGSPADTASSSYSKNGRLLEEAAMGVTIDRTTTADQTTEYEYDSFGRVEYIRNPLGGRSRNIYNAVGQLVRRVDPFGNTTHYKYVDPDVANAGQLEMTTNPEGETVWHEFDAAGRVLKVRGTGTYWLDYIYDPEYGELTELKTYRDNNNPSSATTTKWTYYEPSGLLQSKTYSHGTPNAQTTSYTYRGPGVLYNRISARQIETRYHFNSFGDSTGRSYTNDSDLTPDVTFYPDRLGRPIKVEESNLGPNVPAISTTDLSYSANGELEALSYGANGTDHAFLNGISVTKTRYSSSQNNGRIGALDTLLVTRVDGPTTHEDHKVQHTYQAEGRLHEIADLTKGVVSHVYGYELGTGVISTTNSLKQGNPFAVEHRTIDRAGRLATIETKNGTQVHSRHGYLFDKASRRERAIREDGTYWKYAYNDRGEVVDGRKFTHEDTHLAGHQFTYDYDDIGNRKTSSSGGDASGQNLRTTNYNVANSQHQYGTIDYPGWFDVMGRAPVGSIVTVNGNTVQERQSERFWSSVPAANRPGMNSVSVAATGQGSVSAKQWVPASSVSPSYDNEGNLTEDDRWQYTWNGENRLVHMESRSEVPEAEMRKLEFYYDWMGRRIGKSVWKKENGVYSSPVERVFVYDDWNVQAEYTVTGSGSLSLDWRYVWGIDISGSARGAGGVGGMLSAHKGMDAYRATYDGNGNTVGWLVLSNGVPGVGYSRIKDYDPFGNRIVSEGGMSPPVGFSTKYEDIETGLYYFGHRFYDPEAGRWLSRDPIEESGGVNLYGFVGNNGVNRWDYLGLDFIALMSYPVDLGKLGPVDTGKIVGHYEIAYVKEPCDELDGEPSGLFIEGHHWHWPTAVGVAKKLFDIDLEISASVELLANDGRTRGKGGAWHAMFRTLSIGKKDFHRPVIGLIGISEIVYDEFHPDEKVHFEVVKVGSRKELDKKWKEILDVSKKYRWAEQQGFEKGPTFNHWPNSRYWSPWGQDATNNSNVFARYVLEEVNIKYTESQVRSHPPEGDAKPEDTPEKGDYVGDPFKKK